MINIPKLSKKERLGAYAALFFVVFTFLDRVVISPISSKLQDLSSEIAVMEKAVRVDLEILGEKEEIYRQFQRYRPFIEKTRSDEEEMAFMLSDVEVSAGMTEVTLVNLKPYPPSEVAFYKKYQTDIEIVGEMPKLVDFLYRLRSSKQLLRIDSLKLTQDGKKANIVRAYALVSKVLIP
ncbi:MAG: hypothetical protein KKB46_00050 [Candidatus Omnitrophica bacterium]|nr:hypothetical protein [Candidatus Omnitrophota bacterium]